MREKKKSVFAIVFFILLFFIPDFSLKASINSKISIRLFASLNVDSLEITSVSQKGAMISSSAGQSSDLPSGLKVNISREAGEIRLSFGNRSVKTQNCVFSPVKENGSYFMISTDSIRGRLYSGNIIVSIPAGKSGLRIENVWNLEGFVEQFLLSEFGNLDYPEALNAVGVAIRTYLFSNRGRHKNDGYDFCDTTHCQAFKGWNNDNAAYVDKIRSSFEKMTALSKGMVLTYNGKVIEGYYHGCCGGRLTTPDVIWGGKSDFPYRSAKSPFCEKSRFFRWEREIGREDFSRIFGLKSEKINLETVRNASDKNFVQSIILSDGEKRKELNITDFRRTIADAAGWNKVLSHSFDIELTPQKVIFRGNGFGHSIGLCEACALEMGRKGYSWRNILDFFYYQAEITPIDKLQSGSK